MKQLLIAVSIVLLMLITYLQAKQFCDNRYNVAQQKYKDACKENVESRDKAANSIIRAAGYGVEGPNAEAEIQSLYDYQVSVPHEQGWYYLFNSY